jgi:hypothetical protein
MGKTLQEVAQENVELKRAIRRRDIPAGILFLLVAANNAFFSFKAFSGNEVREKLNYATEVLSDLKEESANRIKESHELTIEETTEYEREWMKYYGQLVRQQKIEGYLFGAGSVSFLVMGGMYLVPIIAGSLANRRERRKSRLAKAMQTSG